MHLGGLHLFKQLAVKLCNLFQTEKKNCCQSSTSEKWCQNSNFEKWCQSSSFEKLSKSELLKNVSKTQPLKNNVSKWLATEFCWVDTLYCITVFLRRFSTCRINRLLETVENWLWNLPIGPFSLYVKQRMHKSKK